MYELRISVTDDNGKLVANTIYEIEIKDYGFGDQVEHFVLESIEDYEVEIKKETE